VRTLTSPSEIDRLFKHGRRVSHVLMVVIAGPAPEVAPEGSVLFVAGKKLGGAVVRNRCKRVLREACRRGGGLWPGSNVALMARPETARAGRDELDAALRTLTQRLGLTAR
jgi:ribonuclease P protein component